jgi:hypothetical protein
MIRDAIREALADPAGLVSDLFAGLALVVALLAWVFIFAALR